MYPSCLRMTFDQRSMRIFSKIGLFIVMDHLPRLDHTLSDVLKFMYCGLLQSIQLYGLVSLLS